MPMSASPPTSSSPAPSAGGGGLGESPSSTGTCNTALPPTPPPAICLMCHCKMRVDESFFRRGEDSEGKDSVAVSPSSETASERAGGGDAVASSPEDPGRPRNLMKIIESAEVPDEAPVCKDCADSMFVTMNGQLGSLEEDCIKYRKLIDDIETRHCNANVAEVRAAIERVEQEERDAENELRALIAEEEKVDAELAAERRLLEAATEEEAALWRRLREEHARSMHEDEETRQRNMEVRYAQTQLKLLSRTSVLALAFPIDISAEDASPSRPEIARIGGFRLGRLPDVPVDWAEVNGAWGQAALLLKCLMDRCSLSVPGVSIVPLCSFSAIRIKKEGDKEHKDLPLYGSGNMRPFGNHNCDAGALKFLELLQKLLDHLASQSHDAASAKTWPFRIRDDKLTENNMHFSVKMQFNAEERWTRAMRCLLLNLKWAMASI